MRTMVFPKRSSQCLATNHLGTLLRGAIKATKQLFHPFIACDSATFFVSSFVERSIGISLKGPERMVSREDGVLKHRQTAVVRLQAQMLNLRLFEKIDADKLAPKARELRAEAAGLRLEVERCECSRNENIDIAVKATENSQNVRSKWVVSD